MSPRYGFFYGASANYRTRVYIAATLVEARKAAADCRSMGYSTGRISREDNGGAIQAELALHHGIGAHTRKHNA